MPIYEYACAACDHQFEEWQKMSDPPVRTCPKCKKKKVERLISATAFHLKGGGWYADLYSSSKKPDAKGGESKSEGKAESKAESKSEGGKEKPAAASSSTASDSKPAKESKAGKGGAAKKADSRAA